jgi:hypothetical protein
MKLETTLLTEAQRCEIIAKLSKLSKWALGREYEVSEGAIQKSYGNDVNLKHDHLSMTKIQPIKTFVESVSATDFKGFEALPSLASTTNCFASMFKQKLDKHMMDWDDCLKRFSEMLTN